MRDRTRGAHLAPVLRRGRFAGWWWTVVGAAALTVAFVGLPGVGALRTVGMAYWVMLGFVVLAELRPVVASGRLDPDGVTLSTAFVFAMLLAWGAELAIFGVIVATTVGETARRKRIFAGVFNGAQYVLSYTAAWLMLLAFGWSVSSDGLAGMGPASLVAVVFAAGAYHLANLAIVGTAIGAIEGRPARVTIFENVRYYTLTTGAVLALAPLVVIVADHHWGFLPLLLLPLYLLWKTAAMSLEREQYALRDGLTGLANRMSLTDHVERHLAEGRPGAICLLDLDNFKDVNDTLGHAVGDQLLGLVADRLRAGVREDDIAARIGGDEFVLLLDVEDRIEALDVVDRLGRRLQQPYEVGGRPPRGRGQHRGGAPSRARGPARGAPAPGRRRDVRRQGRRRPRRRVRLGRHRLRGAITVGAAGRAAAGRDQR